MPKIMEREYFIFLGYLATVLIAVLIGFIAFMIFKFQKKQYTLLLQMDAAKNKYDKEILNSKLEMQDATLEQISRELHDNIGGAITLAKLYMNTIEIDLASPAAAKVDCAVNLLTQSLEDLRNISRSLSLDLIRTDGLINAIDSYVNQLRRTERYTIQFEIIGNYNILDEKQEIILFRILQEAINNIIRHAGADEICIIFEFNPESTKLSVADNGKGFDVDIYPGNGEPNGGSGIRNIKARASLIAAQCIIESSLGKGTRISISIPNPRAIDK